MDYDTTAQKAEVFIFKNSNKDGPCSAKVVYIEKDSAAAAVVEYNNKHVSQWNTRLLVSISNRKRKNLKDPRKVKNEESGVLQHAAKAMTECEKASNKNETMSSLVDQPQSPAESSQATKKKKRRRPQHSNQDDKPTS